MKLCRVEHLLNTFSPYLSSILDSPSPMLDSEICNQNIGEGESNIDDKYVENVFNKCSTQQSCIFPKFTSYKIGTYFNKKSKFLECSGFSYPNFLGGSGFYHPNFFHNCVLTSFLLFHSANFEFLSGILLPRNLTKVPIPKLNYCIFLFSRTQL